MKHPQALCFKLSSTPVTTSKRSEDNRYQLHCEGPSLAIAVERPLLLAWMSPLTRACLNAHLLHALERRYRKLMLEFPWCGVQ